MRTPLLSDGLGQEAQDEAPIMKNGEAAAAGLLVARTSLQVSPDGARPRLVVAGPHDFAQKLLEGRDRGNTRAAVGGPRFARTRWSAARR
jgi:hypothetical protein